MESFRHGGMVGWQFFQRTALVDPRRPGIHPPTSPGIRFFPFHATSSINMPTPHARVPTTLYIIKLFVIVFTWNTLFFANRKTNFARRARGWVHP